MRVEPTVFDYGAFMEAEGMTDDNIVYNGRKNIVIRNERYTIFGEVIDREGRVMRLRDIAVKRERKGDLVHEWETYLGRFAAAAEPAEIRVKRERRLERERLRVERERQRRANRILPLGGSIHDRREVNDGVEVRRD